jgi:cation transport ATPase
MTAPHLLQSFGWIVKEDAAKGYTGFLAHAFDVAVHVDHTTASRPLPPRDRARALSSGTMRNIRQNLFFAFAYNALGISFAAGALYPFFGLLLSPMIASAAMSLSSVSLIANARRLRRIAL